MLVPQLGNMFMTRTKLEDWIAMFTKGRIMRLFRNPKRPEP